VLFFVRKSEGDSQAWNKITRVRAVHRHFDHAVFVMVSIQLIFLPILLILVIDFYVLVFKKAVGTVRAVFSTSGKRQFRSVDQF
jgi:hypothetical protein